MSIHAGPNIADTGIRLLFDKSNTSSYSGSGTAWTDIIRKSTYTNTLSIGAGLDPWLGSESSGITINVALKKLGTFVGYAEHPISKWNNTLDASFVLYHFGTTGPANSIMWYGNRGGSWGNISDGFTGENGKTYLITLQYNDLTGGQLWVNGVKIGSRSTPGIRATSSAELKIFGPVGSSTAIVDSCYMWSRELSDAEVLQNFNSMRGRYGI